MSRDILTFLAVIFGAVLGSFMNVVIYRIPRGESIITPPSRCPGCGTQLSAGDNIPIISYLILRGRCRSCHTHISIRYPLVEFIAAVAAGVTVWNLGLNWHAVSIVVFIYLSLITSLIDLQHRIIPDEITMVGIIFGLILTSFRIGAWEGLVTALLGILAGGGSLYVIALAGNLIFKKESMGGGDIKFAAMLGAFLGWQLVLIGLFLGFCFGAVFGGGMLLFQKGRKTGVVGNSASGNTSSTSGTIMPFGPALALGGLTSLFWGSILWQWYASTFLYM